jgi:hypothetical protein
VLDFFLKLITYMFAVGVVGCAIMLPIVVWRFVSVLFEKDTLDEEEELEAGAAAY